MLHPFPLNRNLVPRFAKGGGAQETMKDALVTEIRECWNSQEDDLCDFPYSFPFRAWTTKHLVTSDGAS
jgi:hypothetical protein